MRRNPIPEVSSADKRRLFKRLVLEDHGYVTRCLVWQGATTWDGYGIFSIDGTLYMVHVLTWTWEKGPVPDDMMLDHLCRWRSCARTEHLHPKTGTENTLIGVGPTALNAQKTHCPKGHEYTPDNTIITNEGWRRCRTCEQARQERRRRP